MIHGTVARLGVHAARTAVAVILLGAEPALAGDAPPLPPIAAEAASDSTVPPLAPPPAPPEAPPAPPLDLDAPAAAESGLAGVSAPDSLAPRVARSFPGRPAMHRKVRLVEDDRNVVRSGPGERFSIIGVHPKGAEFTVIAKSGSWYGVRLSDSETGWIHASLCKEFDDLSDLEFRPNPKLFTRTGSYVLAGYGGAYAFDRKSNSLVLGGRLGYYVFDRLQAEGGVAWTRVQRPAEIVESLFDLSLEAEDFHMLFYHLALTWELMPGRQMVPFVSAGVGSAIMQGETEPSLDFGAGTTLFLSKRTAMRWEVRNYRFQSGADDARRSNNNVAFTLGTAVLF
jgi:outer membrane beta-barrel protein